MAEQGLEMPKLTETTVVAEVPGGRIIAFAAVRGIPWLYLYFDENTTGRRHAVKVVKAAENMMKAHGNFEYIAGIDPNAKEMRELAEHFGFEDQGELMFLRKLVDTLG